MHITVSAITYCLLFALLCALIADRAGRDTVFWAIIGFLLGLIALVILILTEKKEASSQAETNGELNISLEDEFINNSEETDQLEKKSDIPPKTSSKSHEIFTHISSSENYESYLSTNGNEEIDLFSFEQRKPSNSDKIKPALFIAATVAALAALIAYLILYQ